MKVTWLGQAGLLFEKDNVKIMVDPYLSDSCAKQNPQNKRRMPVNLDFFSVSPDILVFTHAHLDHLDPDTYTKFLDTQREITVLAPEQAWHQVRAFGRKHNYVMLNRYCVWSERGIRFHAVRAEHSDTTAIGVILEDGQRTFYITGDTLYHTKIFADIPEEIDVLFLPINGIGNNMNPTDAAKFAEKVQAKRTVPIHWGMFDNIDPQDFPCENKVIPEIYKEIVL